MVTICINKGRIVVLFSSKRWGATGLRYWWDFLSLNPPEFHVVRFALSSVTRLASRYLAKWDVQPVL